MLWNAQARILLCRSVSYPSMASISVDLWFFFQIQIIFEIHNLSYLLKPAHFTGVLIVNWWCGVQMVELKQVQRHLEKEKVRNPFAHFLLSRSILH